MDKAYTFRVQVKALNGSLTEEKHTVNEQDTQFGESFACGKVVRFYDGLKAEKKIKDYRLLF